MKQSWVCLALLVGLMVVAGCEQKPATSNGSTKEKKEKVAAKTDTKATEAHSGWWCDEHGVPEEECTMCNAKLAKAAKAKGDWCDKHDRAKSICFICDPSLEVKYAAKYRAKYGKEPPKPEEQAEPKKAEK